MVNWQNGMLWEPNETLKCAIAVVMPWEGVAVVIQLTTFWSEADRWPNV